jgi:exosortase A-associated hydrolase 1
LSVWRELPLNIRCDGEFLPAILHAPLDGRVCRFGILVVVGGPQYRVGSHRQFVLMARALASQGIPVLRFDYRGMGDAGGTTPTFEHVGDDIRAALDAWNEIPGRPESFIVWGLCDAASAAFMNAANDSRIRGVIAANPWVRTDAGEARSYVRYYYGQRFLSRDFWTKLFSGRVSFGASLSGFITSVFRASVVRGKNDVPDGGYRNRMLRGLQAFQYPVLLLLSGRDLTAREFEDYTDRSPEWQRELKSPRVTTVRLPVADHTFSARQHLDEVGSICARWIHELDGEVG